MFNHEPKNYNCPLCVITQGKEVELTKREDVIFEDKEVVAYISPKWWVNNPGNVIVIPRKHVENIYDISDELLCKIQAVGKKVATAIKETYGCDGVSLRQHNEPAGGQDIWHFHLPYSHDGKMTSYILTMKINVMSPQKNVHRMLKN